MAHDRGSVGETIRRLPERALPTRADAALFAVKVAAFQTQRLAFDLRDNIQKLPRGDAAGFDQLLAQARTPLWSDIRVSERAMQRGKVHNLRIAARRLDGALLGAGAIFSFWREVGAPSRARGFVAGRMLQEGCLVSSAGGGLCQLSNALYDVALRAGCEIIERHAHSRIVPGSVAEIGRDATVAWNYVDLRFASARPLLLRVTLDSEALTVSLYGADDARAAASGGAALSIEPREIAADCASCGETTCFRHGLGAGEDLGAAAFMVDEYWPEFDDFIAAEKRAGDTLCVPIDGQRWKRANYAWRTHGLKTVTAPVTVLTRAAASRRLAAQGAARQTQLLHDSDRMAARLARGLTADVTDVIVSQTYLAWLWRNGHLGGRQFSVLMTRLPMSALHARLDAAFAKHPERPTLGDFRADAARVRAEDEALAAAQRIVTPHTEIAELFGERAALIEWKRPPATQSARGTPQRRVAFPGPVAARKGAYEVRRAALDLDLEVALVGGELEGADFWARARVLRPERAHWLDGVAAVVQPALVEDRPRALLAALAAGVPLIATPACGLPPQAGLTLIAPDDVDQLKQALERLLPR